MHIFLHIFCSIKTSESKLMSLQHELESSKTHNSKLQSNLQKLKVEVQLLRKKTVLISRVGLC